MTAATIEREQTATTCTCYYGETGCPVCPPVVVVRTVKVVTA